MDQWEERDDPLTAWFDARCERDKRYSCSQQEWLADLRLWWTANRTERNLPPTPEIDEWLTERGHPSINKVWQPGGPRVRRRVGFKPKLGAVFHPMP